MNENGQHKVMVVTGTRAEFGLLRSVMHAIHAHPALELYVVAAGSHLVQPAVTFREVKAEFAIADSIPMQTAGKVGRLHDVESLGKGIARFGRSYDMNSPDMVVVLGDRIEAFAAASAASVGGVLLAHIHGGDRAEGVADEAMRHAITKLAHVHFPATNMSAKRIVKMGEDPQQVIVVGSPAIDGLDAINPMGDGAYAELGSPQVVVLMHPIGRDDDQEAAAMQTVLDAVNDKRVLVLHPNLDPGRRGIMNTIESAPIEVQVRPGLPRDIFVGLLKRVGAEGGALVGNSSAGLIEASAIGCPSVDIGDRQSGRERCEGWTMHADESVDPIREALKLALDPNTPRSDHPYGDGTSGPQIASQIAQVLSGPESGKLLRKRCMY
ncbi:MAG: UDP-N-acetylglucosamine 2-epimerase (hydrolyzing) [Phycisphaerae bacterium]|nr:UDP-N-acetylglucosamine 2-epimerase (hydrolyzing) [Phycisphaerae bacterium]MBM92031.1 UDP-N-acetylglucosamine 2-epimerase (hydrolyzing) [Phycisphaerae bacterium]